MVVYYLVAIVGVLVDHLCNAASSRSQVDCLQTADCTWDPWIFLQLLDDTAAFFLYSEKRNLCVFSRKYAALACGCMRCTRFTGEISIFLARSRKFISKCSSLPFTTLSLVSFHGWCTPLGLSACRTFVKPCWKVSIIMIDYELLGMKLCSEA